jgi:ComEC/Rec2-related protein
MRVRFVSHTVREERSLDSVFREWIKSLVVAKVGDDVGSRLFLSMALGFQDLLSVPLERAFMNLGLTHLLVVSGYQVGLMYAFFITAAVWFLKTVQATSRFFRPIVALVGFATAAMYVACIGSEMSAVRALIAVACLSAHGLLERTSSFAQRWGVALLVMLILWPWCFFDIGVILTFAALLGIGIGSSFAARGSLASFVAVNIAVWVCTSLVVLVWRGYLSPLGLSINLLLAAPWSILNCTVGLTGLVLLAAGIPGAASLLWVVSWCNETIATAVLLIGESSWSGWQLDGLARSVVAVGLLLIFVVAVLRAAGHLSLQHLVRLRRSDA